MIQVTLLHNTVLILCHEEDELVSENESHLYGTYFLTITVVPTKSEGLDEV